MAKDILIEPHVDTWNGSIHREPFHLPNEVSIHREQINKPSRYHFMNIRLMQCINRWLWVD
ncbi:MAG: hypothetical protein KAH86_07850 [Methanosarcinales archaeon]|nr:hypothetical protein [Methanosarcinales archaeon]